MWATRTQENRHLLPILRYSPKTGSDRINDLLVQRPKRIPLERHDSLRRSLNQHELPECLYCQTAPANTAHSGKSGIIPATNSASVNEPVQLALRQQGINEIQTATTREGWPSVNGGVIRLLVAETHLKSQMFTMRSPRASIIQKYWAFLSRYSFVLKACVTPSNESTTGQAKSYVG